MKKSSFLLNAVCLWAKPSRCPEKTVVVVVTQTDGRTEEDVRNGRGRGTDCLIVREKVGNWDVDFP